MTEAQTPDLVVRLRDVADQPLAQVTVIIRDQTGTRDLAHTVTDVQGEATVAGLTSDAVRVAVQGRLPSGPALHQLGDDAPGMLVVLVGGTLTVDLVSDDTGVVQPNPLTMTALEPGMPLALLPTAPFPTPSPTLVAVPKNQIPSVSTAIRTDPTLPLPTDAPPAFVGSAWGLILLGGLLALGIGMLGLYRHWRAR
jgi:hypothetical protein